MDKPTIPPEAILAAWQNASPEQADAFLAEQTRLARLQAEELASEARLHHWRSRVEHWSGVLKLGFETALALAVVAVLVAVAAAVASAAGDKALVIEPFSVPADLASRGLTGEAIAAHLQDKLAAMQAATQSVRQADSYSNNWGDDIKVQIPETGVSIGEVHRLLVAWLGRQTHITGDIYRTETGITITTRAGGDGAATLAGGEADLDKLLQQTAEAIYLHTQPYRYAVYLGGAGRLDTVRERAIYESLLANPSPRERAWAYIGLSNIDSNIGEDARSLYELHRAAEVLPGFALPWQNMTGGESSMGHEEDAVKHAAVAVRLLPHDREVDTVLRAAQLPLLKGEKALLSNDYAGALREFGVAARYPAPPGMAETIRQQIILAKGYLHDGKGVKAAINALPPVKDPAALTNRDAILLLTRYALGDWSVATADRGRLERDLVKNVTLAGAQAAGLQHALSRQIHPYFAIAFAMHGELGKARALVGDTPLDCDICLRARGIVAAKEHRWAAAEYWFERAVRHAPSIALGYYDWGMMLLAKGDRAGAMAKFAEAHEVQPLFADPLEAWGEALILAGRSDLALAKFAEAARTAPNWGRLHLKWGEALFWLGRKREAKEQFALAAGFDLTASERTALARLL